MRLLFALFLILSPSAVMANELIVTIRSMVGEYVEDATVEAFRLKDTSFVARGAYDRSYQQWRFKDISPDSYIVRVIPASYVTQTVKCEVESGSSASYAGVILAPEGAAFAFMGSVRTPYRSRPRELMLYSNKEDIAKVKARLEARGFRLKAECQYPDARHSFGSTGQVLLFEGKEALHRYKSDILEELRKDPLTAYCSPAYYWDDFERCAVPVNPVTVIFSHSIDPRKDIETIEHNPFVEKTEWRMGLYQIYFKEDLGEGINEILESFLRLRSVIQIEPNMAIPIVSD